MLCALCRLPTSHAINAACRAHLATGAPSFATILADQGVGEKTLRAHLAHLHRSPPQATPPLPQCPPPPAPARAGEGRLSLVERAVVVHRYVYNATDDASLRLAVRALGNLTLALAAAVSHEPEENEPCPPRSVPRVPAR